MSTFKLRLLHSFVLACLLGVLASGSILAAAGDTTIISLTNSSRLVEANEGSEHASISADGRFVAFCSYAKNLVSNDTNGKPDIFVFDQQTGLTERISSGSGGAQANGASENPYISADGRFVTFQSDASNLVSGDTNEKRDIFVFDRQTSLTDRVSLGPGGVQANFQSSYPSISSDGRFVAFESYASNLVTGDTNVNFDVFVHDRQTGVTERISVGPGGVEANTASSKSSISNDGRYVAFQSSADNLVSRDWNDSEDIFIHDRQTGVTERVSVGPGGLEAELDSVEPSLSADGGYVAFTSYADNLVSGDTNGHIDIFIYDRQAGVTERVSIDSNGAQANLDSKTPSISTNGRFVAFQSLATNLVSNDMNGVADIFVHDRQTGLTERVSVGPSGVQANSNSSAPSISSDGRFVAFESSADNLVSSDTNRKKDIFVFDRQISVTERAWVGPLTREANANSFSPSISDNGRYVAFQSYASNLVSSDTNGIADIFVHDRQTSMTDRVSLGPGGVQANSGSSEPSISTDGRFVAFTSDASNLVNGDTNGHYDTFVRDRQTGVTERVSLGPGGAEANDSTYYPSISADGRYVTFQSNANNLVSSDTNHTEDIFVHDRQTSMTDRVSLGPGGVQANSGSSEPSISTDGRYVAFTSDASNLVSGDTNGRSDIFVLDRQTGVTERISVDSNAVEGNSDSYYPSISDDGRFVVFQSSANNLVGGDTNTELDIFFHDRQTGMTERVSVDSRGVQANYGSDEPTISADGHYVSFTSAASNLVSGDMNGTEDIFLHELEYVSSVNTTTTVSCTNPVTYGSSTTCTATVTRASGSYTPGGSLSWASTDGGIFSTTSCTLSGTGSSASCSATYTPNAVGDGLHRITASYGGDAHFNGSSGNQDVTVNTKALIPGFTAANKVYDGTTSGAILTRSLSGVVGADTVSLTGGTASFNNKNAGNGKTVTGSGFILSGTQAGNYHLAPTSATTTANITPRSLTVSATGVNKVYDGTTGATVMLTTNALTGDAVTAAYTAASFATSGAGKTKTISVSGISISGADAGNYSLSSTTASTSADITPKPLTVTADNKLKIVGEPDPSFTYTASGFVGSDTFSTAPACSVPVPHEEPGDYEIVCSGGVAGANYTVGYVNGTLKVTSSACFPLALGHSGQGSDPVASPSGSPGCPEGQYQAGTSVNLSGAMPESGWKIGGWSGTNNDASTASTNTVTMPEGDHTASVLYLEIAPQLSLLKSIATQDGWVLESSENSSKGGALNGGANVLLLGDNAQRKQYRSILSFSTKGLPDEAVITKVILKIRKQGTVGDGNPVNLFQGFLVDIRKGYFGTVLGLQASDFQAKAHRSYGPFKPALANGWYTINLTPAKDYINPLGTDGGVTQLRLRFKLDDNNDAVANALKLYSGNAPVSSRPQLIIEYYVP